MLDIYSANNPIDLALLKMLDNMHNKIHNISESGRFFYNDFEIETRLKLLTIVCLGEINLARTHTLNLARTHTFLEAMNWQEWSGFLIDDPFKYPYLMALRIHDQRYLKRKDFNNMLWPILYESFRLWGINNNLIKADEYCPKRNLNWLKSQLKQYPTDKPIIPQTSVAKPFTEKTAERVPWISYLDKVPSKSAEIHNSGDDE